MFLDIACFFIGEKKDTVIRIWDGCPLGFRSLQNKNLVDVVGTENEIRMHDHLRDLGRDLAKNPDLPLRIWRREDMDVLQHQSSEATEVRGIRMGRTEYEDLSSFLGGKMKKLQLLVIEDFDHLGDFNIDIESILDAVQSPNLIWLRWNTGSHSSLPWILMRKLRVLEVCGSLLETLWQEESQAPLELRELRIEAPRLTSLPESFGNLIKLRHLELFVDRSLEWLPDSFGKLINLQHLNLSECSVLKRLPDSFGNLKKLQHLNLSECSALKRLPDSFGNLIELQHLDLSRCFSLEWLSDSFGNLRKLKYLDLSGFNAAQQSAYCSQYTLVNISTLEYLSLCWCDGMEVLPFQLTNQRSLEILKVSGGSFTYLPSDIGELRNLKKLELLHCYKLKCLPDSLVRLNQLTELSISYCEGLEEVGTLPDALIQLNVVGCNKLRKIEGICSLAKLRMLCIIESEKMEVRIERLLSLEYLEVKRCPKVRSIRGLARLTKLRWIILWNCYELKELVGVEHLSSLEELNVRECPNLQLPEGVDPRCIQDHDYWC